jgi:hypothetical protein
MCAGIRDLSAAARISLLECIPATNRDIRPARPCTWASTLGGTPRLAAKRTNRNQMFPANLFRQQTRPTAISQQRANERFWKPASSWQQGGSTARPKCPVWPLERLDLQWPGNSQVQVASEVSPESYLARHQVEVSSSRPKRCGSSIVFI